MLVVISTEMLIRSVTNEVAAFSIDTDLEFSKSHLLSLFNTSSFPFSPTLTFDPLCVTFHKHSLFEVMGPILPSHKPLSELKFTHAYMRYSAFVS